MTEPTPINASVDALPGLDWNAHAVAGDILNRCPINAQIIALWIDNEGMLRFSKTTLPFEVACMFSAQLQDLVSDYFRYKRGEQE